MGADASNYWLLHNDNDAHYIGIGGYRRYLLLTGADNPESQITMPATVESCEFLSSDEQRDAALKLLEDSDCVTNRSITLNCSVEQQYLMYELPEHWHLFKQALLRVNPSYESSIDWFVKSNLIAFNGTYIMKKHWYKRMMYEFYDAMQYVWENCSAVFPDKSKNHYNCSEPFPWRYVGFINERFVPFFIHANNLKKVEVPLVFLE